MAELGADEQAIVEVTHDTKVIIDPERGARSCDASPAHGNRIGCVDGEQWSEGEMRRKRSFDFRDPFADQLEDKEGGPFTLGGQEDRGLAFDMPIDGDAYQDSATEDRPGPFVFDEDPAETSSPEGDAVCERSLLAWLGLGLNVACVLRVSWSGTDDAGE